jgi:hypothetical protein
MSNGFFNDTATVTWLNSTKILRRKLFELANEYGWDHPIYDVQDGWGCAPCDNLTDQFVETQRGGVYMEACLTEEHTATLRQALARALNDLPRAQLSQGNYDEPARTFFSGRRRANVQDLLNFIQVGELKVDLMD